MPQRIKSLQDQLNYHLAVDRLLRAAETVKSQRERLLKTIREEAAAQSGSETAKPQSQGASR